MSAQGTGGTDGGIDTTFTPTEIAFNHPEDTCLRSGIFKEVTILCESAATYYGEVKLEASGIGTTLQIYQSEFSFGYEENSNNNGIQTLTPINIVNNEIILSGLNLNSSYSIYGVNSCGDPYELTSFSTSPDTMNKHFIHASNDFLNEFRPWGNPEAGDELFSFVFNMPNISVYEKMGFIQDFYFEGGFLPDTICTAFLGDVEIDFDVYSSPRATTRGGGSPPSVECICAWIINGSSNVEPNGMAPGTTEIPEFSMSTPKESIGGGAETWYYENMKGPARETQMWSEGWKVGGDQRYSNRETGDDETPFSPTNAYLRYQNVCEGFEVPPSSCECTKPINFKYRYTTDMMAYAVKLPNGIGNKNSRAAVEEWAIITTQEEGEEVEVIAADNARVESECSTSWNTQFFLDVLSIATQVANIVVFETVTPANINNISNALGNIVSNNIIDRGCNASNGFYTSLVDDEIVRELTPNKEFIITLNSYTSIRLAGKRRFFNYGLINSEFLLAAKIPYNVYDGDEPDDCCSKKAGNYVTESYINRGNNAAAIKNSLADYFGSDGPWDYPSFQNTPLLTSDSDGFVGFEPTVCNDNTTVVVSKAGKGNLLQELSSQSSDLSFSQEGDQLFININNQDIKNFSSSVFFGVYDVQGRLIKSGTIDENEKGRQIIIESIQEDLNGNTGIYFLNVSSNKINQTTKFLIQ